MNYIPLEMALACAKWPLHGQARLLGDPAAPGWVTDCSMMAFVGVDGIDGRVGKRTPPPGIAAIREHWGNLYRTKLVEDPRYRIDPPRQPCGGYWDNADGFPDIDDEEGEEEVECPGDFSCPNCEGEKLEPGDPSQTVWRPRDGSAPTILSARYARLLEGLDVFRIEESRKEGVLLRPPLFPGAHNKRPPEPPDLCPVEGRTKDGQPLVVVMPLRAELREPTP